MQKVVIKNYLLLVLNFYFISIVLLPVLTSVSLYGEERSCDPPPWHNHPQLVNKINYSNTHLATLEDGIFKAEGYVYYYAEQIDVRSCLGMLVVEPIFVIKDGTFVEIAFDDKFREILSECANAPLEFGYHRFIPTRTHDKKRTYDIIKVVPFISDEDRYEELTPFPLANLNHHPLESCEVKVKGTFIREENPIHPKFTSIYKPKNPPKRTRIALRLMELSIKK